MNKIESYKILNSKMKLDNKYNTGIFAESTLRDKLSVNAIELAKSCYHLILRLLRNCFPKNLKRRKNYCLYGILHCEVRKD